MLGERILQLGWKVTWDELLLGCEPSTHVDIWKEQIKERTDLSGTENRGFKMPSGSGSQTLLDIGLTWASKNY